MSGRGTLVRMGVLALLWGSSFLWIKIALGSLSPVQIAWLRISLGALVLVGLCYAGRKRLPTDPGVWGHLVVAALFGNALPFVLFAVGEQTVDSGVAGVLNATTPLWALLIGVFLGQERRLWSLRMLGLVLGFAGTLLIFAPWQSHGLAGWGAVAILGGAASYAVSYAYIGQRLSPRGMPPIALSAAQLVTATGLTTLAVPFAGLPPTSVHPMALVAVTVLGVFGTGFAFAINYRLIADEGATNATVVGYLLPVVSVLLGAVVLDEQITPRVVAGMVVVLLGVGLTRLRGHAGSRRPVPTAAQPAPAPATIEAPAARS